MNFIPDYTMGPPAMVYKTKADYSLLVPVVLSDDKMKVIGYPGKTDLSVSGEFPYPLKLNEGYFLDQKGIYPGTAFIRLTYPEYEKLKSTPTTTELYEMVIDKDPFIELCNCGSRKAFANIEAQLNSLIVTKKLRTVCRVVK